MEPTTNIAPKTTEAAETKTPSPLPNEPTQEVQKTVQTVHDGGETIDEKPGRQPCIEIAPDDHGEYHWCLWSGNGRPIAAGVIGFKRRNDCQNAANTAIELFRTKGLKINIQVE